MSREEAQRIVDAHKRSQTVTVAELQTAVAILARKRDTRMSLPRLTEAAKAKANLALVWNLWQAMPRAQ